MNGNSDKLGKEFVNGAKESNHIEEIFIRDLNINGCLGCEYCYGHSGIVFKRMICKKYIKY